MRPILVAAMALLLSNSLCVGVCLVAECAAAASHASGCRQHQAPQHQAPQHKMAGCTPQPAAAVTVNSFSATVAILTAFLDVTVPLNVDDIHWDLAPLDLARGSPPRVSVLRI